MHIAVIDRPAMSSHDVKATDFSRHVVERDALLASLSDPTIPLQASPGTSATCAGIHLTARESESLNVEEVESMLGAIRATSGGALLPIIIEGANSPRIQALANQWPDSPSVDIADVTRKLATFEMPKIDAGKLAAEAERLLRWWSAYPQQTLVVSVEPALQTGCHWPLLSAWGMASEAQRDLLALLGQRGWLSEQTLVTRTRHCRRCRSMHLNYVDVCPRCRHLDLKPLDGLHCFACGHVDRVDHFTHGDQLTCPKCHVRLRHIGVDYDRPLESLSCAQCDLWLVEGEVQAHCLDCGQQQQPGELIQHRVASLRLSEAGRRAINSPRQSTMSRQVPGQRVTPNDLHHMLDLLVPLARRHSHHHLLMVLTRERDHGVSHLAQEQDLLDSMAQRLASLLRDTDLVCEYDEHQWLFLLPHTPRERFEDVSQRIKSLMDLNRLSGKLPMTLEMHELPDEQHVGMSVDWLPGMLAGKVSA